MKKTTRQLTIEENSRQIYLIQLAKATNIVGYCTENPEDVY